MRDENRLKMKKSCVGFFILFVLVSSLFPRPSSLFADASLEQQAQAAWQDRARLGQTEKAIRLWTEAVRAEPNRADLWIGLAKAQGRAVRHATQSQERKKWADDARASADHAIRIDRQSAEA